MMSQRPTWAAIDLAAIQKNVKAFKSIIANKTKLCAVVKADGYGHGASQVAREALTAGVDYLAVAVLQEALQLREDGITSPLLVLGYTPQNQAHLVVSNELAQTIFSFEQAKALSDAAISASTTATVHLKVDTGMGRLGVSPEMAGPLAAQITALPGLVLEGVFTHFAQADSNDKAHAYEQFTLFQKALKSIAQHNIEVPIKHCANSAATIDLPEMHLDMVRMGVSLYGLWPSEEVQKKLCLTPAMQFYTRIAMVKKVPAGTALSYGSKFVTEKESLIATLPVGYADGWTRMLSGKANVLVNGKKVPVVGRICMDQCMIDVSAVSSVAEGDTVLLFGGEALPAEEVAAQLETINYEVVCMVGKRVPRVYYRSC